MLDHRHMLVCTAALCATLCLSRESFAASAAGLVEKGNHAFRSGKYDEALACYEKALVDAPESAHIYFNKGAAHFRKGNYKEAAELFESAALKTKDLKLEAKGRYNQGNCMFRESERQRDSDLQKSLEALRNAVARYQQALKLDPALKDAAHNIEVSRLIMKQILDELKRQQEQARKEQQKRKEQTEKLKELVRQQEELAARTEALDEENSQPDQMSSSQAKPDETATEAVQHLKAATAEQSAAGRNLSHRSLGKAHANQENAIEEMKKALGRMSGASPGSQQQKRTGKPEQHKESPAKPEDQANDRQVAIPRDETAHDILDQEKENRKRRERRVRGGYSPVDKDW